MNPQARKALELLLEGNRRFRDGENGHYRYEDHHRAAMVQGQDPIAAVVACVDSRVSPEAIFDQPLGSLFVSRVPANVASDSAKWMIDIAVGEFKVPLLVVLGHSGCLALKQVMDGKSGPGGLLRFKVQSAVSKAMMMNPADGYNAAIRENALQTIQQLHDESWPLRDALRMGTTTAVAGVFDIGSGTVEIISPGI